MARALVAHVNSPMRPKVKFHPNWCGGGVKKVKSKSGKAEYVPITKDKATTYTCTCKRYSTWSSSQSLKRNHQRRTLVCLCLAIPSTRGKERHHWGNNKNKCWVAISNGSRVKRSRGKRNASCTFCRRTKGMHKYKLGRRRSKWRVIKGSNTKLQAQAIGGGKGAKEKIEKLGEPHGGRTW